jgi:D-3-phosphoglycerate dehydrogenase / 2-oxoglutarate reductase
MASERAVSNEGTPSPTTRALRILVVGDAYFSSQIFARSLASLDSGHDIAYVDVPDGDAAAPATESERQLREFSGSPAWVAEAVRGHDVLVVHGAPVSAEVLDAAPELALVCCARGGPVNVDVDAAAERGIPVVTTPGKNAEGVADLALAFMVMLARRIPEAIRRARDGDALGASAFEGAELFGSELGDKVLGLVGYGNVGARVSVRARGFGMDVAAYDPFVPATELEADGVRPIGLDELLGEADFVSVHARATPENAHMFDARRFAAMKDTGFFLNTARASLVDEHALEAALVARQIAGAALDVLHAPPSGGTHPLTLLENVIVTPHVGGATHETLARGAAMVTAEIERFARGERLRYTLDRERNGRAGSRQR